MEHLWVLKTVCESTLVILMGGFTKFAESENHAVLNRFAIGVQRNALLNKITQMQILRFSLTLQ